MRQGIYETIYGNAAFVSGPKAKSAFDIDMQEKISLCMINSSKFIRTAKTKGD